MSGTWWVDQNELDDDQRKIISLPIDDQVLVTGPPGSGKTNLLLLRANYLHLAGKRNIAVVVFTRSLREFIARGAAQYDFPTSKIMTCRQWQVDLLRQYGGSVPNATGNFEADRTAFVTATTDLANTLKLSNVFPDAILLDEGQDYTPDEIRLFERLTERLCCVADERQKIYEGEDSLATIKQLCGRSSRIAVSLPVTASKSAAQRMRSPRNGMGIKHWQKRRTTTRGQTHRQLTASNAHHWQSKRL